MNFKKHPWQSADATQYINFLAEDGISTLHYTAHCKDRMKERGIIIRDILYVLKHGFVYTAPDTATRDFYKYKVESVSPNSENRKIRVVVLVDETKREMKIITVMFVDEL